MTELDRLELILRRIMAKRERDHRDGKTVLNVDTQDLLREIAEELALLTPYSAHRHAPAEQR